MTVESNFTNDEWVAYNNHWVNALILATLGLILFAIGFAWGLQGMESFVQETNTGVTFVEGGLGEGTFKGPLIGTVGVVLFAHAPPRIHKAYAIKRRAI